ncbi:MAG: DNA polymerase I [Candidatus Limnocylindrales bacterium]|jgi:DNA polymerase-1
MTRLMLLDSNGLIYRGYHALPPLTTSKGELVNAVFGFCSILLRGIQDVQPEYVAACFDLPGPTFRHEQFSAYKATRTPMPDDLRSQFPKVRQVVAALRIPVYEMAGFEADDVIGTITRDMDARGIDTTVVTGDLDMLQLVTDRTRLMTTRGGVDATIYYDPARIWERFELRPDQMVDYKALKGDPTDNIPGIPGVGEKTAAKLVGDFGSVDGIYARLAEVRPDKLREKLAEAREQVMQSRELSRIIRDLPISLDLAAARLSDYDRAEVVRLFRDFEFRTLIDRLPPLAGESAGDAAAALRSVAGSVAAARVAGESPGAPRREGLDHRGGRSLIGDGAGLQLSMDFGSTGLGEPAPAAAAPAPTLAEPAAGLGEPVSTPEPPPATLRTVARAGLETGGPVDLTAALRSVVADPTFLDRFNATADEAAAAEAWLAGCGEVGAALLMDDPRPMRGMPQALALAGPDGRVLVAEGHEAVGRLGNLLLESGARVIGHEAKPLMVANIAAGAARQLPVAFDTQIAAYLLNASLRSQTIADVAHERLDVTLPPAGDVPPAVRVGLDALATLAVREPLEKALAESGLDRLFREVELPLIPVLAGMEAAGVAIDRGALAVLDVEFTREMARLESEIYADVGHEFNLGSPKQLEQILFYELNLPKGKRTKTGYSTDASVLEELKPAHPMIGKLLDWRLYSKLRSTYIEALPALVSDRDGRLHTTFHQAVAATGRLSSSDPNLQNIPVRSDPGRRIRRAFVAGGPDVTLLAADYSQIELRILAHVSGDEHLRDAFARGADIHRETAARVLHKAPEDVTHDERSMAKMVNFGLAYGMSDFGLSSRAGISRAEAREFIDNYFATYSGISYYMLHIKELARQQGWVSTLLGRRRFIPELRMSNPSLRGAGERMAINMPIQGTAADIIKIAMIRLPERLRSAGLDARLLLQVHDELVLEVPRDQVEATAPILRETMEGALKLDVPLTVDVKMGDDWESMRPLTREDEVLAELGEAPAEVAAG